MINILSTKHLTSVCFEIVLLHVAKFSAQCSALHFHFHCDALSSGFCYILRTFSTNICKIYEGLQDTHGSECS
jgi:hypothetical protein